MMGNAAVIEVDAKQCGVLMRADLRRAFPGIPFSVKMSRGTAWGNYSISWTDGPTVAQVEQVIGKYEGKGFDGMTDSTYYNPAVMEAAPDGLRLTKYHAGLLLTQRNLSPEFCAHLAEKRGAAYWADWDKIPEYEQQRRLWQYARTVARTASGEFVEVDE